MAVTAYSYDMPWSACYWRLHYFWFDVKEYRWTQWDVKTDYSQQSLQTAWVEAVNKVDSTIRVRITCTNGKYIILDTRVE